VKTVGEDTRIRYADWVRENREYVDKKSHGQLGYIHLYDMDARGLRQFARDYPRNRANAGSSLTTAGTTAAPWRR